MAKITSIMADLEKSKSGVWKKYGLGIELRIASINNQEYKNACDKLLKPHFQEIHSAEITNQEMNEITKPAAAKHLLLDWKNIEDENGNPIPYSTEKALEFFNNPTLHDLYEFVLKSSRDLGAYLQGAEKN